MTKEPHRFFGAVEFLFGFKYSRAVDQYDKCTDVVENCAEESGDHAEERKSDHRKADENRENEVLINDLSRLLREFDDKGNVFEVVVHQSDIR